MSAVVAVISFFRRSSKHFVHNAFGCYIRVHEAKSTPFIANKVPSERITKSMLAIPKFIIKNVCENALQSSVATEIVGIPAGARACFYIRYLLDRGKARSTVIAGSAAVD